LTDFSGSVRRLLDGPDVAVLSTTNPDGTHHVCVMWVSHDDDALLMVTKRHRRQYLNLLADPRATVLVYARARPTYYVEIRGHASFEDEGADALMDTMAHVYTGTDYVSPDPSDTRPRVIIRIEPDRILEHGSPT
jgi:PPOX class probable F420-dependent enzyme